MFSRPMVAFDGTPASQRALEAGCEIAVRLGVELCTVTVIEGAPEYLSASGMVPLDARTMDLIDDQRNTYAKELVNRVHATAKARNLEEICADVGIGDPIDVIIDAINKRQCDLLIIGLRAHPGLIERLLPHTGRMLTDRAPCSVLGIR